MERIHTEEETAIEAGSQPWLKEPDGQGAGVARGSLTGVRGSTAMRTFPPWRGLKRFI